MLKKLGFAACILGSFILTTTVFAAPANISVSNPVQTQCYGYAQLIVKNDRIDDAEKAKDDKRLAKANEKKAKEDAKKKAKADAIAEKNRLKLEAKQRKEDEKREELERKAMAKREKARQELVEEAAKEAEKNARKAKNSKHTKPDDGFTRIAKADEAEWEAAKRAKIEAENANELDDAFAIGKK